MRLYHIKPASRADRDEVAQFLELGRQNYDFVIATILAVCSENDYVTKTILEFLANGTNDTDLSAPTQIEKREEVVGTEEIIVIDDSEGESDANYAKEHTVRKNAVNKRKQPEVPAESSKITGKKKTKKQKSVQSENLVCLNCNARFNSDENQPNSCKYHPGESTLGELEDNPTCDDIEDDWPSRETWPNAFNWECCETTLEDDDYDGGPCHTGAHRAEGDRLDFAVWQKLRAK